MVPIWKGSPNCWKGRDGHTPVAIVDHRIVGTLESAYYKFQNSNDPNPVSAHFGVAKDGRIWQFVSTLDTAWANGPMESPDMSIPWLADCAKNEVNPNNLTVSIEHEGNSGDVFTEAQYLATLGLHRLLIRDLKIKPDRQHIIGHYQIMKFEKANCPGSGFPWARLMGDLALDSINDIGSVAKTPAFNVGPGITGEATRRGLTMITDEQYYKPSDPTKTGLGQRSFAWAKDSTGQVFILMAFESVDGSGKWEIKVVKEV